MLHQIGSGVLGPVFRTYDPQGDRLVAVKVFRLDLLPEDVARLADLLRRLSGAPGFVAAGLENTSAYLATDYLAGETLDVALRHLAPAPLETALPILERAAKLIDAAWAGSPSGISPKEGGAAFGHGALHPRDIFVTPDTNEVAITGFGVVPALEALDALGAKPPIRRPYTAPERAAARGPYDDAWDIRADIYSLAAIAHELLTGRRPAGPSEQDGSLPSSMPPETRVHVRRVLSKALAESPSQRFRSAAEFVAALGDLNALPEPVVPSNTPVPAVMPPAEPKHLTLRPVIEDLPSGAPTGAKEDEFDLSHVIRQELEAPVQEVRAVAPTPPAVDRRSKSRTVAMPVVKPLDRPEIAPIERPIDPEPRFRALEPSFAKAPEGKPASPSHEFPMPPPTPWLPMVAVAVACLILGAAIDHQWLLSRPTTPTMVAAAPTPVEAPTKPAVTKAPATSDTEVKVDESTPARSAVARPSAPAKKAPSDKPSGRLPGRITIRSVPVGAAVTIDGKAAGRTPLTATGLSLAGHSVVIARSGFVSETRRVTLSRSAPATSVAVILRAGVATAAPGATTGSVAIDSRPRGARITIDGRPLGQSPASVPGLSPGRHALRLELDGYKPLVTAFRVKAGETARVAVTLEIR